LQQSRAAATTSAIFTGKWLPKMRHNREEVIERTIRAFESLDRLAAKLTGEEWDRRLPRPETKDP
jgi:hypothetical protein